MKTGEVGFRQAGAGVQVPAPPRTASPPPARILEEGPSPFQRLLQSLGRSVDRGETVVRSAVEGAAKDLGPGELLALQAGVYRYSEAVDLSSKLIDRATSGVKTVLQGQ